MDVFFGLLPIIVLVYVTVKKNPWPTTLSLPFAAVMLFLIRLMYYASDVVLTCGAIVLGLHEALSPITIIAGAMFLFETMEATKCMPYMMREMKALTDGHPISECML
jgi:lactate permease